MTSACSDHAQMHWHGAHGAAQWVGPGLRAAACHPRRPPTRDYSPIYQPRSSSRLEPPEEHGHCLRGSTGGWSPDRRACPCSRPGRHPRRGGHPVAPQLSWTILVVSWPSAAPRHRRSLPIGNHCLCFNEVGSLAGGWREAVSMPPSRLQLPTPSPRRKRQGSQPPAISAGHLQKGKVSKGDAGYPLLIVLRADILI